MVEKLSDKARAARNAYYREYRARNREKIKATSQKYWERKALENAAKEAANEK